ncbi:MAG: hypothetical protein U0168_15035 [Nannocystaceae bacterium]|jgi:hypothetical protein
MPRRDAACVLAVAIAAGCTTEQLDVLPAIAVHVRTVAGEPVAGARVLLQAETQPHASSLDPLAIATTDADGMAHFDAITEQVTQHFWIMHGVTAYSHHICVEHPVHGVEARQLGSLASVEVLLRGQDKGGVCIASDSRLSIDRGT